MHPSSNTPPLPSNRSFGMLFAAVFAIAGAVSLWRGGALYPWLFGLSANPSWWWTIAGPVSITLMFRFVSLPMIEARMLERRPDYAAHAQTTSLVIPWPPRRSAA